MRTSALLPLVAVLAVAACGTAAPVAATNLETPGVITLPGDVTPIVALPACASVSVSQLEVENFRVVEYPFDLVDPGTSEAGDEQAFRVIFRAWEYDVTWDGAQASDVRVESLETYPDAEKIELVADAEADCVREPGTGNPVYLCSSPYKQVSGAIGVDVTLTAAHRCSPYQRATVQDYVPPACIGSGIGWTLTGSDYTGLQSFVPTFPLAEEHRYKAAVWTWCEDEAGKAVTKTASVEFTTPRFPYPPTL